MDQSKKRISVSEAIIKIRTYCNYRERCHYEVRQKLYDLGLWTREVDEVLNQMLEEGLLNEERYARSYVRGHFYIKKWGKRKIAVELKKRQIHTKLIQSAMGEIAEDDYLKLIETLAAKKLSIVIGTKMKKKQKVSNYLMQKGFDYSDFKGALDRMLSTTFAQ